MENIENSNEEPNDIDQIYRVLKQAGELSGDKTNASASGSGLNEGITDKSSSAMAPPAIIQLPEIPIVTEPDYPERNVPSGAIGGQSFTRSYGTNERSNLAVAPLLDVSSTSGADDGLFSVPILHIFHIFLSIPLFKYSRTQMSMK